MGGRRKGSGEGTSRTSRVKGGELTVQYADDTVYLTGDAVEVYKGVVRI